MPKYETPEKIQAARVILLHKMPYLASALFAVTFVPNPHVQTMGIDRWWRVYYNPDQLEKWTIGEVAAVILHEVHHVLHDHHDRSVARGITPEDHLRWNIAADIPINDGLTEGLEDKAAASHMTIKLPEGCVYSSTFGFEKGLLAETYFDLLESKVVKVYVLANGSEGSGAGTGKVPGEAEEGEPKPGETPDAAQVRFEVASAGREHAKGQAPGSMPGWMKELIDNVLGEPKIPWQRLLKTYVRRIIRMASGRTDYTFTKPARRQHCTKVILPGMVAPEVNVSVLLDTSGSMSQDRLRAALTEINGVLKACGSNGAKMHEADTEVTASKKVRGKLSKVELTGRGGTDMAGALQSVWKMDKPQLMILMTDGETGWPPAPLPCPVIVCIINAGNREVVQHVPEWAKTVYIGEEGDGD